MTDANAQTPVDEDIVVEIEGDASEPAVIENEGSGPAAAEPKVVSAEEGMAELRASLETERRGRVAAEERAAAAQRDALAGRSSEIDGRLGQVNSAIETLTSQSTLSKRDYAAAMAAGEYERAADIQFAMAEQASVLTRLREGKNNLEAAKKAPQAARPAARPAHADPVEAFASTLYPKAAAWVRSHPDFVTDPKKNKMMQGAHHMASSEHEEGSEGYFAALEKHLGIKDAVVTDPIQRRAPAVAAPVSRSAPTLTRAPSTQRVVKLTADEKAYCDTTGVPYKTMAREKAKFADELASGQVQN